MDKSQKSTGRRREIADRKRTGIENEYVLRC